MAVPDFQSFFAPLLNAMADGGEHTLVDVRQQVQSALNLSEADLLERLPRGNQTKFVNRLAWAGVYFAKAGVLKRVRRGVFQITDRGKDLLNEKHQRISVKILSRYPEFVEFHKGSADHGDAQPLNGKEVAQTPEEQLAASYEVLRQTLAAELLDTVKKSSPAFFEKLVIELLVAMGYGGSIDDAGRAVGGAGDGGIDGIIKEDRLGLDVVYIQAKRWGGVVGRPVVQAFAGSLEGHRARKGVLITTSGFSQDAFDYIQRIEKKIVLIDGKQLTDYMIDFEVGVTKGKAYVVKKIDQDYFEES
jgi:restriction system protein